MSDVEYRDLSSILGFPGYRVGSDGSVWSCWKLRKRPGRNTGTERVLSDSWRLVKPRPWSSKCPRSRHLRVELVHMRIKKKYAVHRLVLEAFVGPCPDGMEGCHDPDPNPSNNAISNLRWDTKKANQADRVRHGTDCQGVKHPNAKLTEEIARAIIDALDSGVGCGAVAKQHGLPRSTVSNIKHRGAWKHLR